MKICTFIYHTTTAFSVYYSKDVLSTSLTPHSPPPPIALCIIIPTLICSLFIPSDNITVIWIHYYTVHRLPHIIHPYLYPCASDPIPLCPQVTPAPGVTANAIGSNGLFSDKQAVVDAHKQGDHPRLILHINPNPPLNPNRTHTHRPYYRHYHYPFLPYIYLTFMQSIHPSISMQQCSCLDSVLVVVTRLILGHPAVMQYFVSLNGADELYRVSRR